MLKMLLNPNHPSLLENFKWRYLCTRSSSPLHVWFYGGVFRVGRSNGIISGSINSKMAAGHHLWKIPNGDISGMGPSNPLHV